MSLAAFPIQTSDMPRRPLRKQHFQAHGNAVLGENSPKNNALEAWFLSQTTLTDPPNGRLISKATLTDPPNGHRILKATLTDPLNGRLISKTTLADPLNGHQILKTTLADGSEAGFSRKTTKTITAFRLHFIPARHATKSRLPGTRSTAACLYIDDPSAFNPTISHSRSPADGADWRSWDTCAHSS